MQYSKTAMKHVTC